MYRGRNPNDMSLELLTLAHEMLLGDLAGHSEDSDGPAVRDDADNVPKEEDSGWSIRSGRMGSVPAARGFAHRRGTAS